MSRKIKSYYTAGELAEMFSLPKQTLLYYDKMGILKPEFISENNYRHYSMSQYMLLEIIIALRKLNVSINEIKEYLNHRSPDKLEELLINKQTAFEEQIRFAQAATAKITSIRKKISHARHTHTGQITLEHRHKQTIILSDLSAIEDGKKLITIYASHNLKLFESPYFKDKATGWIVNSQDYLKQSNHKAYAYYTVVDNSYTGNNATVLEPGLYLSTHYKGVFHTSSKNLSTIFNDYIERNQLRVVSDIYCMPLVDHWLSNDPDNYITRISMRVEYK